MDCIIGKARSLLLRLVWLLFIFLLGLELYLELGRACTDGMRVMQSLTFWRYTNQIIIIRRIHGRQHAFTDDTGMSKRRVPPYNAYYHNWQTVNFTASDSLLLVTQPTGRKYGLPVLYTHPCFEVVFAGSFTFVIFIQILLFGFSTYRTFPGILTVILIHDLLCIL